MSLQALLARERTELAEADRRLDLSSFRAFCASIDVTLGDGQAELARVAFDGEQPDGSILSLQLFGSVERFEPEHRSVVNVVAGGRAGKSYALIALRMLFGMLVRDLSSAAPGQLPIALIIARNDTLRKEVVRYAVGAAQAHPELAAMLAGKPTTTSFSLKRRDGALVGFETGVAAAGGYGARGRSLTDFAMDEAAFFYDAGYAVNDEDIFAAGSPRVLPGGQTIVASTPWAELGLLYDLHVRNHGHPIDAIGVHAPTLVLRDTEFTRALVARERIRNPENCAREFDARFQSTGTTQMFSASLLQANTDAMWAERLPLPGERVAAGGDLGFTSDRSALAIVHDDGTKIRTGELREMIPLPGEPLKPSVTVATFADRMKAHRCTHLVADAHYKESIVEHLRDASLHYVAAPTTPSEAYVRVRQLLNEGRISIPNHPGLIKQLQGVQALPTSGGRLTIVLPRTKGKGHSDLVSAWILACYQISGDTIPLPPPIVGSLAWEERLQATRRARLKQQQPSAFWKKPRS